MVRYLWALIGLLSFPLAMLADTAPALPTQHIIIIDAGSSGTRLHLFAYQQNPQAPSTLTAIKEIKQIRAEPGLTGLPDNAKVRENYFNRLFDATDPVLTVDQKSQTPVYLFATAGFRLLDKTKQKQLLSATALALSEALQSHHYRINKSFTQHVKVIYGRTEALFALLTINYLMQNLHPSDLAQANNFGVLDLGGASTQMTFLAKKQPQNDFNGFVYQQQLYLLYAKTYPQYGVNQAELRLKQAYGKQLSVCYPQTHQADFTGCLQLINRLMDKSAQQQTCRQRYGSGECNALGAYQPSIDQTHFIAIAYYYTIFQALGLADQIASLGQLKQAASQFCKTPWSQLVQSVTPAQQGDLATTCLRAAWIYALLRHDGFHDQTPLIVTATIAGQSTDWPLGAAIYLLTQAQLPISLYES